MFKQTALITWHDGARRAGEDRLRGLAAEVEAELAYEGDGIVAVSYRGGDVVWHLHFADQPAWRASGAAEALEALAGDPAVASVDAVGYVAERRGVADPALAAGVYRTLFIAVEPHGTAAQRRELVEDLAGLPRHIPEIVNWGLNPVAFSRGDKTWTHVWEQEYRALEDLAGPYIHSPYHLYHVDRWFDAEMPCWIIAPDGIRHSASTLEQSVIRHY